MQKVHEELERILPKAIALAEDIFKHPELGYKEFRPSSESFSCNEQILA